MQALDTSGTVVIVPYLGPATYRDSHSTAACFGHGQPKYLRTWPKNKNLNGTFQHGPLLQQELPFETEDLHPCSIGQSWQPTIVLHIRSTSLTKLQGLSIFARCYFGCCRQLGT